MCIRPVCFTRLCKSLGIVRHFNPEPYGLHTPIQGPETPLIRHLKYESPITKRSLTDGDFLAKGSHPLPAALWSPGPRLSFGVATSTKLGLWSPKTDASNLHV